MRKLLSQVKAAVGLHARPAAIFVQKARIYRSEIAIRNVSGGSDWADAKSILSVLALGVEKDHEVELQISGSDEDVAAAELADLLHSDFGEH